MPRALASVAWHRWTGAPCWCPARDAWPIRARSTGSCAPWQAPLLRSRPAAAGASPCHCV